jgi:hypothetical protein
VRLRVMRPRDENTGGSRPSTARAVTTQPDLNQARAPRRHSSLHLRYRHHVQAPPSPHTPDNWDAASRAYAEVVSTRLMEPFADALLERLAADVSMKALEVAAGTGALTVNLAPRVESLLATDFAPKMIEVLRERLSAMGQTNVTCEVMDGQALSVDDASFDRAAYSGALQPYGARRERARAGGARPDHRRAFRQWTDPLHQHSHHRLRRRGVEGEARRETGNSAKLVQFLGAY